MIEIKKADELKLEVSDTKIKSMLVNSEYLWMCHKNPSFSDVTLIVEDKEFPASRIILAMHSTFFEALFNGNLEEGQQSKIPLEDVKLKPFEILLHYMYSGDIRLASEETYHFLDVLSLAHFFGLHVVVQEIADYMETLSFEDDTVEVYNKAVLFDCKSLAKILMQNIFVDSEEFIHSESFMMLNEASLSFLLEQDKFSVEECTIVKRVAEWLKINKKTGTEELLKKIRLTLIDIELIIKEIRPMGLFTDEQIFEGIVANYARKNKKYRCNLKKIPIRFMMKANAFLHLNEECNVFTVTFHRKNIGRVEINIAKVDFIVVRFDTNSQNYEPKYKHNCYVLDTQQRTVETVSVGVPKDQVINLSDISVYAKF